MGCDIHIAVQARDQTTGQWADIPPEDLGQAPLGDELRWQPNYGNDGRSARCPKPDVRDYRVFSWLCGVRAQFNHDGEIGGRGYPDGVTSPFDLCEADIHSRTHATAAELLELPWDAVGLGDASMLRWLRHPVFGALLERHGAGNLRLVFGFDN